MMNPEEQHAMQLNYKDVAECVFQKLIELGYVPVSDEVLDISDIVFEMVINVIASTGANIIFMSESEDGDFNDGEGCI